MGRLSQQLQGGTGKGRLSVASAPKPEPTTRELYQSGKINVGDVAIRSFGQAAGDINKIIQSPYSPVGMATRAVGGFANVIGEGYGPVPGLSSLAKTGGEFAGKQLRSLIGGRNIDKVVKYLQENKTARAFAKTAIQLAEHPQVKGNLEAVGQFAELGANVGLVKAGAKALNPIGRFAARNLQPKVIKNIADSYRDVAGQTQKARTTLGRAVERGKDPAQFLAERNIVPEVKKGKMLTEAASGKLDEMVEPLNRHLDLALKEIEPGVRRIPLADVEAQAISRVRSQSNINKNIANELEADVRAEFNAYRSNFGNEVTVTQLNGIKQGKWARTPFDVTKPYKGTVNYEIGRVAKDTIEQVVPKELLGVRELNSAIGDILEARKFLDSLNGRVVRHGRLGGLFGRTIGAIAGSGGGPIGTILGALGGDAVIDIIQKSTFSNPLKQIILRNLQVNDPLAYQQAIKFIGQAEVERATRLALPEPRVIYGQPYKGSPIQEPPRITTSPGGGLPYREPLPRTTAPQNQVVIPPRNPMGDIVGYKRGKPVIAPNRTKADVNLRPRSKKFIRLTDIKLK